MYHYSACIQVLAIGIGNPNCPKWFNCHLNDPFIILQAFKWVDYGQLLMYMHGTCAPFRIVYMA